MLTTFVHKATHMGARAFCMPRNHPLSTYEPSTAGAPHTYFSVNADIFLRTLCLVAVTVWFTRSGAAAGVTTLAANALLMQLFMLFSYFMDGFAYAGEALGGRFHGAGDNASLHRLVGTLLRWGAWLAAAFAVVCFFCGGPLLRLLTDRPEETNHAAKNTSIATAMDASIARVRVSPMKTPSQTKAHTPASGTRAAHGRYSMPSATTSGRSVSSRSKGPPQKK